MHNFEKIIKKMQIKQNAAISIKYIVLIVILALITFNVFYAIYSSAIFTTEDSYNYRLELFLLSISLRIFLGLVIIYLVLSANNSFLNKSNTAKYLDQLNEDSSDTYQIAWDFSKEGGTYNKAILDKLYEKANKISVEQKTTIDYIGIKKNIIPLLVLIFSTVVVLFVNKGHFKETLSFFTANSLPPVEYKTYIELIPGNHQVIRNSDLTIEIIEPETRLEHNFFYRIADVWREAAMPDFQKKFLNIDHSFDYFVQNDIASSDTFRIEVFELPVISNLKLEYNFPSYTGLVSETHDNSNGNITAVRHTNITLSIESNNPIETSDIFFSSGEVKKMERTGRKTFRTGFELINSGSYHIRLVDIMGSESRRIERNINVINDNPPRIEIVHPPRDTTLNQNLRQNVLILSSDDYGLVDLLLHYEIESPRFFHSQPPASTLELKKNINKKTIEFEHIFDLSREFLLPGDRIIYWAEVFDNSPNQQSTSTARHILRLPSVEEIFQQFETKDEEQSKQITETLQQSEKISKEFEEKRLEIMKKEEIDWQDKQDIENLMDQQKDLSQQIEDLAKEYDNMIQNMHDNQVLSSETLEKMQRIKELMEEISNEQLAEAMRKMEDALESMDRDSLLKAMEDMKFSMEEFNQRLENTLDLLENIRKEQNIQKALAISEEMVNMQESLLERTEEESQGSENLAQEQQNINEKLDALKEQLEKIMDMLDPQKDQELLAEMNDLMESLESGELDQDLSESLENLQQNKLPESAQSQKKALEKMKDISQQLTEMNEAFSSSGMDMMMEILTHTIRRLLAVAVNHDELRNRFVNDPFTIYQDLIGNFDATQLSVQKLYSMPQVILFINPKFLIDTEFTIRAYRELFSDVSDSRNHRVRNHLSDIQKGTNLMIYNLMQSTDNMQSGQGGGMDSLMQSLMQMGEEQMALNMMTQQVFEQLGEDGSISRQMREQMQRLASDQERIAENLRRTLQNNPEAQKQAHSFNQMIEELDSIARDLRRSRITEELIGRQERILSRLLDAQRSVHQREFSRQREGERPEFGNWVMPEDVQQEFDKMRQRALLEENFQSLPREYQELIREYHRIINEKSLRNN